MKTIDALVIGLVVAAAFIAGVSTERYAGQKQLLAMQADRIAREGKTDKEWYVGHPHDAGL